MQTQCNLQVTIEFGSDTPITKDQCAQVITDMLEDNKSNVTTKLYTISDNENFITFSIDCQLGFIFLFIEIMKNQYQLTPEFVLVRNIDENAYEPEMHYASFMQFYRDMVTDGFEEEDDEYFSNYMENTQDFQQKNADCKIPMHEMMMNMPPLHFLICHKKKVLQKQNKCSKQIRTTSKPTY